MTSFEIARKYMLGPNDVVEVPEMKVSNDKTFKVTFKDGSSVVLILWVYLPEGFVTTYSAPVTNSLNLKGVASALARAVLFVETANLNPLSK